MTKELSEEELLNLAKGVTEEAKELTKAEELRKYFLESFPVKTGQNKKEALRRRRQFRRNALYVRRKLHWGQDTFTPEELAVKEIVESQLRPNQGITWESFTMLWDISPSMDNPGKIIQKHEWFKEGGKVDDDLGSYYPSAFTEQELG